VEQLEESAVAYDGLPISSGGAHGLGRISARDSFSAWLGFLGERTDASQGSCSFSFPHTPGLTADPGVVKLITREFPGGRDRHPVPWDRVDDALSVFESLEPLSVNKWEWRPSGSGSPLTSGCVRPAASSYGPGKTPGASATS
jgi:hypothetical protein